MAAAQPAVEELISKRKARLSLTDSNPAQNRPACLARRARGGHIKMEHLATQLARIDKELGGVQPSHIVLGTGLAAIFGVYFLQWSYETQSWVRRRGALRVFFETVKALPVINGIVAREKAKLILQMDSDMGVKLTAEPPRLTALPAEGISLKAVLAEAETRRGKDLQWDARQGLTLANDECVYEYE